MIGLEVGRHSKRPDVVIPAIPPKIVNFGDTDKHHIGDAAIGGDDETKQGSKKHVDPDPVFGGGGPGRSVFGAIPNGYIPRISESAWYIACAVTGGGGGLGKQQHRIHHNHGHNHPQHHHGVSTPSTTPAPSTAEATTATFASPRPYTHPLTPLTPSTPLVRFPSDSTAISSPSVTSPGPKGASTSSSTTASNGEKVRDRGGGAGGEMFAAIRIVLAPAHATTQPVLTAVHAKV